MSFSRTAHILFISFLLIALYVSICVHTALNAPLSVTQYLFSESGAFEVLSPWLWYLLAMLCLLNTEIKLNTRIFTAAAAILLGFREMDFHKRLFDDSFIKTNFYRSAEIPLMDKLLGFILLLGIIFVFMVLAKKLVNTIRSMKDSLNIAHFFYLPDHCLWRTEQGSGSHDVNPQGGIQYSAHTTYPGHDHDH